MLVLPKHNMHYLSEHKQSKFYAKTIYSIHTFYTFSHTYTKYIQKQRERDMRKAPESGDGESKSAIPEKLGKSSASAVNFD